MTIANFLANIQFGKKKYLILYPKFANFYFYQFCQFGKKQLANFGYFTGNDVSGSNLAGNELSGPNLAGNNIAGSNLAGNALWRDHDQNW